MTKLKYFHSTTCCHFITTSIYASSVIKFRCHSDVVYIIQQLRYPIACPKYTSLHLNLICWNKRVINLCVHFRLMLSKLQLAFTVFDWSNVMFTKYIRCTFINMFVSITVYLSDSLIQHVQSEMYKRNLIPLKTFEWLYNLYLI